MNQDDQKGLRYRISHRTEYRYSENVAVCQNQVRMQPVTGGNVSCEMTRLTIHPTSTTRHEHLDYFGNRVITFSIEATHNSLIVEAESRVRLTSPAIRAPRQSVSWESLLARHPHEAMVPRIDEHRFRSPRITPAACYADYAAASFPAGRGIVDAALDLIHRIHQDFKYDTTATNVDTTTDQAFQLRAGVCQDFAHVGIACFRSIGLAARYVSGYLRTVPPPGKERLVGADESHAWLEVYCGVDIGWLGLDPTNACLVTSDHIPVCVGRDYDDVSPMRGVVIGGGTNTLKVNVDVEPITESSADQR
ncbi:MAG: transglutaminase family protein [Planctomycetales bacterium]|nr:transglutaminase family protein [Planctomycetales bacterium]